MTLDAGPDPRARLIPTMNERTRLPTRCGNQHTNRSTPQCGCQAQAPVPSNGKQQAGAVFSRTRLVGMKRTESRVLGPGASGNRPIASGYDAYLQKGPRVPSNRATERQTFENSSVTRHTLVGGVAGPPTLDISVWLGCVVGSEGAWTAGQV
jgi:hypothetical protein